MLANIVNGLPLAKTKPVWTTLIVVPPSLLSQWFSEVVKHCEESNLGEVLVYHSKSKVKSSCPELTLTRPSIVLTTYSEVARSAPKVDWPPELITEQEKIEWFEENREKLRGPLHRIMWHRIVLDEAHVLKSVKNSK
jgi:SNF2 family DNA or RNA helicase